jgi:hypothetical protein
MLKGWQVEKSMEFLFKKRKYFKKLMIIAGIAHFYL